jgi:hypothetical protein
MTNKLFVMVQNNKRNTFSLSVNWQLAADSCQLTDNENVQYVPLVTYTHCYLLMMGY